MNKNRWFGHIEAISTISGTIVGAGIFVLPWVAVKSGFLIFFSVLLLLLPVLIFLHLAYAKVVMKTEKPHRFIGYVGFYFGRKVEIITSLIMLLVFWGSLLVYLILGVRFLCLIVPSIGKLGAFLGVVGMSFAPVFFSLRDISWLETISIFLILGILVVLPLIFHSSSYKFSVNLPSSLSTSFAISYGTLMYALYGISAVPEVVGNLEKRRKGISLAIIGGIIFSAILYTVFVLVMVRIFGVSHISKDAVTSFFTLGGKKLAIVGKIVSVLGLLAVLSSFWVSASNLKHSFEYDFKVKNFLSWCLTLGVPLLFYFLASKDFVRIISLMGTFGLGAESILILLMYKKVSNIRSKVYNWGIYFLMLVFFFGMLIGFFT